MFFLDLQTLRAEDEGWLVLDVTAASDRWLLNRNKDLGLRLYVETEDGKTPGSGSEPSPGGSDQRGRGGIPLCGFPAVTLAGCLPFQPCFLISGRIPTFTPSPGVWGQSLLCPGQWGQSPKAGPRLACVSTARDPVAGAERVRERSGGEEVERGRQGAF